MVPSPETDAVRSAIIDPLLQRLYDYWQERRSLRPMPSRADIDPVDMRFILGNILLVDVLAAPRRFHIRLHGTNLVRRAGYELTGKALEQLPDAGFRGVAHECFTTVVETRQPAHARRTRTLSGRPHAFEAVVLPLSRATPQVDMLLVGLRYATDSLASSIASAATQTW